MSKNTIDNEINNKKRKREIQLLNNKLIFLNDDEEKVESSNIQTSGKKYKAKIQVRVIEEQ